MQGQAGPSWQDGADVNSYSDSSTVSGPCRELEKISLVTKRVHYQPTYRQRCGERLEGISA